MTARDILEIENLQGRYMPVSYTHLNHLPGLERAITACFELMKKRPSNGKVNLLGQRMGSFETTELCHILKENNVEIGMELPI